MKRKPIKRAQTRKTKKRLTKKQAKFVQALVNPKVDTVAEAARIAGYGSDRQRGHEALQSVTVQESLKKYCDLLDKCGATDEVTAQRIAEGLHAQKVSMFGKVTSPDFEQRGKYIDRVNKIRRYLDADKESPEGKQALVMIIGEKGLGEII